eukprot:6512298-Ditylum_brightwellii.AAC.1
MKRCPEPLFALEIDATKVATLVKLASDYSAILGGEYPNHTISIKGTTKEEAKVIIDCTDGSTEVKICVMTFQNAPTGVTWSEIVAARPQPINELNKFMKAMEIAASTALVSLSMPIWFLLNFCVDELLCKNCHVWLALCLFLSCQSNHTGATDTTHNCKSWRYQLIARGDLIGCTMG